MALQLSGTGKMRGLAEKFGIGFLIAGFETRHIIGPV